MFMKTAAVNIVVSILMCCICPRIAIANVIKPGWWSTGYHVGYCIYNKNVSPDLHFLALEIGRSDTGASQYTTCHQGKWIVHNACGYKTKMICTTVGINGQRGTAVTKITFHKENKRKFSISINSLLTGKYKTTYEFANNKCPVIKYPWIDAELNPGVPIPLWLQNVLLKKISGG